MCGGTWPPTRGEPSARTDRRIMLDGADDLIDALLTPVDFHLSGVITGSAGVASRSDEVK